MTEKRSAVALVLLAGLLALTQAGATSAETNGRSVAPLAPISDRRLAHCERSAILRPVCPRSVPRVPYYLSHLSLWQVGLGGPVLDVFSMESGGELPRTPTRNRPPRMAHVVVVAGVVERRLVPFRLPRAGAEEHLRDGIMRRARKVPVSFGRVRWAGREGTLYLAPGYPTGGVLGNHLNFGWRQHGRPYLLSLHAWEPLTEAAATLRTMVERVPTLVEADRLRRLSPTRTLSLPSGPAAARATITAPSPGRHAFDAYVVVPGRADVGIRIETAGGRKLLVLDSTTRFGRCNVRPPLRTCFVRFARASVPRGGRWALVVTKRSDRPATVRIDLAFSRS